MKLNWGFGIAVVYIAFGGSMIAFAVIASRQDNDLVAENYYEQAVSYQKQIDSELNSATAANKLTITYNEKNNSIELRMDNVVQKFSGELSFYKPDHAGDDFKIPFSMNDSASTVPLKKLAHGYWDVTAAWSIAEKNFSEKKKIFIP